MSEVKLIWKSGILRAVLLVGFQHVFLPNFDPMGLTNDKPYE